MTSSGSLTGDEVRRAVFRKPPLGKRGYDPDQVDAFLQRVADALDGSGSLTVDEVNNVIFPKPPLGNRGYNEEEVDAILDVVASTLRDRAAGVANPPAAEAQNTAAQNLDAPNVSAPNVSAQNVDSQNLGAQNIGAQNFGAQNLGAQNFDAQNIGAQNFDGAQNTGAANTDARSAEPLSGYQLRQTVFRNSIGVPGYDKKQVDEFMERAADTLDGSGIPLTADQVDNATFGKVVLRRGYHPDEVNAMLNRIAAELRRRSAGW